MTPRLAITATFVAFGLTFGLWAGASGAVVARVGMGASVFGFALTAFTAAYLAAMSSGGAIAHRITVKGAILACLFALGPVSAVVVAAPSAIVLVIALIVYGALAGLLDATMNAEGARVERDLGKPIFLSFHGGASGGSAAGALLGSWLVSSSAPWTIPLIAELGLLFATYLVSRAITYDKDAGFALDDEAPTRLITRSLVVLGLTVGASIACETAAMSWSTILLRREAPDWAALSGLGAAFFASCQAALRLNADWIRHHVSDRRLIIVSLGVAASGFALVALHAGFATSVIGFAIVGAGTGAVVPCGFALAASRPGLSAVASISAVSFFGGFPRLPAPLLTGVIADAFSLSTSFLCLAGLLLAAVAAFTLFVPSSETTTRVIVSPASIGGSSS
jgi:MFS family permease